MQYVIELKKVIVVSVEADSEEAALNRCMEKDDFQDSWYYAEPEATILETEEGESNHETKNI